MTGFGWAGAQANLPEAIANPAMRPARSQASTLVNPAPFE